MVFTQHILLAAYKHLQTTGCLRASCDAQCDKFCAAVQHYNLNGDLKECVKDNCSEVLLADVTCSQFKALLDASDMGSVLVEFPVSACTMRIPDDSKSTQKVSEVPIKRGSLCSYD